MTDTRLSYDRAAEVVTFFERHLCHTKGIFAGKPFLLHRWQKRLIMELFGRVRYSDEWSCWVRQYDQLWLEVGRGNGKSEVLAGIALYLLVADGEETAEVYGAAADRDQAGIVFGVVKRMIELSPSLAAMLKSNELVIKAHVKRVIHAPTNSFYQVIAADAAGNLGQNPHGIIFDEVETQKSRELWDALIGGMTKRVQPLMVAALTAHNDVTSFAYEEHQFSERIAADQLVNPHRLVFIRNTPMDADWRDETLWHHANPAIASGFKSMEKMRQMAREAEANPRAEAQFRIYQLNQWMRQTVGWVNLDRWRAGGGELDLAGKTCFGGLDLASTADFAAWVLAFPMDEGYAFAPRFYLPRAAVEKRGAKGQQEMLEAWERAGWLTVTDGNVTDYDEIERQMDRDAQAFHLIETAYDSYMAPQLVTHLTDAGLVMWPCKQTMAGLGPASKLLERTIENDQAAHDGNPIMEWMFGNVVLRMDSEGNIKPDKAKSSEKIDGVVAAVMALAAATRPRDDEPEYHEGLVGALL